jgi:uncharacterized membrane protein (UPF0127 family)
LIINDVTDVATFPRYLFINITTVFQPKRCSDTPSSREPLTSIENLYNLRQNGPMKRVIIWCFLLVASILTGCGKDTPSAASAANSASVTNLAPQLPTQAQPKLQTMKMYLGPATLDTELALTFKEEETGMMFRTNIQETDSMLFVLPAPQKASFWMKNCPESISAAYITPDGVIQEIHHLEQNDTKPVYAARDDIQFVLETSDGWFARHNVGIGTLVLSEKGPLADVFLRH